MKHYKNTILDNIRGLKNKKAKVCYNIWLIVYINLVV
jgi:hypothetical protein